MVTIRMEEVAHELGLSIATVSRALRGDLRVAEETRQRVEAAARRLNYHLPSDTKGSRATQTDVRLRPTGCKRLHFLVIGNDWASFFAETLMEAMSYGQERGFQVIVEKKPSIEGLNNHVAEALTAGADAIMLGTWDYLNESLGLALRDLPVPFILVNRHLGDMANAVTLDDFAAGWQAARYLTGLGHIRIAHLPGPQAATSMRERTAGFRAGLETSGCYLPELFVEPRHGHVLTWAQDQVEYLLSLPERPTAIWTHNDVTAGAAVVAVRSHGLLVPHDISIMGFDYLHSMWPDRLTTFDYRLRDLGRQAVHLAEGLITGSISGPVRICVVPRFVEGITTGKIPEQIK